MYILATQSPESMNKLYLRNRIPKLAPSSKDQIPGNIVPSSTKGARIDMLLSKAGKALNSAYNIEGIRKA